MSDATCPGCGNPVTVVQTMYWDPVEAALYPNVWWHFACRRRATFIEKQPSRLFQIEGIGL